jgi:hypothetical protein
MAKAACEAIAAARVGSNRAHIRFERNVTAWLKASEEVNDFALYLSILR